MKTQRLLFGAILMASLGLPLSGFGNGPSVHGVLMTSKGDVKILRANGKTDPGRVGQKVFPKDTVQTGADSRAKIVMSDKNVINVSPDSSINFENYEFKSDGEKKNVSLNVLYGKIRSTVNQKYDGEESKFQVKTPSAVAGVRGTDFVMDYSKNSGVTKTVTFEGAVAVGSKLGKNGKIENPVMVKAGSFTMATKERPPMEPKEVPKGELAKMENDTDAEKSSERKPANEGGGDGGGDSDSSGGEGDGNSSSPGGGDSDGGMGGDMMAAPTDQIPDCTDCVTNNLPGTQLDPCTANPEMCSSGFQLNPDRVKGKTRLLINIREQ